MSLKRLCFPSTLQCSFVKTPSQSARAFVNCGVAEPTWAHFGEPQPQKAYGQPGRGCSGEACAASAWSDSEPGPGAFCQGNLGTRRHACFPTPVSTEDCPQKSPQYSGAVSSFSRLCVSLTLNVPSVIWEQSCGFWVLARVRWFPAALSQRPWVTGVWKDGDLKSH